MRCSTTNEACLSDRQNVGNYRHHKNEQIAHKIAIAIQNAALRRMSADSYFEASLIADAGRDPFVSRRFDELVFGSNIRIELITERQAKIAREAYRDFGTGSGHRAQLSFGDCFSYALAKDKNEPLLFVGDDFVHTDVKIARK